MSLSKATAIQQRFYTINKSPANLLLFETHLSAFKVSEILTWFLCILHLIVHFSLAYKIHRDGPDVPWPIWIALLSEFFLTIPEATTACTIIPALFSGKAAKPRPNYRLCGLAVPSVDIMITCCGEPVNIIINTVLAAAAQDYPAHNFRVFVLDDGQDAELRHAVDMLQLRRDKSPCPSIIYLSRKVKPGEQSHFKSGNIRFGIEESQRLEPGSELLAGLDADMIPEPDWLRRMVPHLILQDELAMACGPQRYYNVPAADPLGQQADFDIYFTVQELLNDCLGAPMCTGTGYVTKRSAIAQIGGWPLAYAGEDYMCSALLTGAGREVGFVRAPLQTGLAPESLTALVKQRMRWTDAGLEVHQRLGAYVVPSVLTAHMKPSVRAVNMIYVIRDYCPMTTVLAMVILPFVLIPTNGAYDVFHSIAVKHEVHLIWAQRIFLAAYLARTFNGYFMYRHVGLSRVANFRSQELWTAPYSAYRCLISLLTLLPLPQKIPTPDFTVCGATATASPTTTNERSPHHRANLLSRLRRPDITLCSLFTLYALLPLSARLYLSWSCANDAQQQQSPFPFPSLLLKLLAFVLGVSKPIRYMVWPPTAPAWEELVVEDEMGVKRPKWERGSGSFETGVGMEWVVGFFLELWVVWLCRLSG